MKEFVTRTEYKLLQQRLSSVESKIDKHDERLSMVEAVSEACILNIDHPQEIPHKDKFPKTRELIREKFGDWLVEQFDACCSNPDVVGCYAADGIDRLNVAFEWRFSPQGVNFWDLIRERINQ